jgi:hypothetical protein
MLSAARHGAKRSHAFRFYAMMILALLIFSPMLILRHFSFDAVFAISAGHYADIYAAY